MAPKAKIVPPSLTHRYNDLPVNDTLVSSLTMMNRDVEALRITFVPTGIKPTIQCKRSNWDLFANQYLYIFIYISKISYI